MATADPTPSATTGRRRALRWAVVAVLLGQMAFAMVTAAREQSPTIDEPVYIGAGAAYLQRHTLQPNPEHPPLGKLVVGAGVAAAGPRLPTPLPADQGELGRSVIYGQGNDPGRVLLFARLPVIVLTLLFGLAVLAFATELAGAVAGCLALALYAFSPDLVAHGSLATLDLLLAGALLGCCWLLWRARSRPRFHLPAAGLALGVALATKMTALAAVPLVAGLALWSVTAARGPGEPGRRALLRRLARGLPAVLGMLALAVAVVWLSYLAVDPRLRWVPPADLPAVHGLRARAIDLLPFPRPYRDGIRIQLHWENQAVRGFLFGHPYRGGRWYHAPAALLVKSPLGALALWTAGAVTAVAVPRLRAAAGYLLLPAGLVLAVAMSGSRNFGTRYTLAVPMFLAVVAGTLVVLRPLRARVAVGLLAGWVAVSSLRTFPYYLPYSNEAFGGPEQTYRSLHDASVDWGQDLGRLADRLRERYPDEAVWLVYKGGGVPAAYGIPARDPLAVPPQQVTGLLAVSRSAVDLATGRLAELLADSRPVDQVGHSITLFRRRGG